MSEPKSNIWEELSKPFPPEVIGKKGSVGSFQVDYVGHAAVTDRLNSAVGPKNWNWEPLALDEYGFPRRDKDGNLWIKLSIRESPDQDWVTRLGYGDGSKSVKELIGDALRNAAMRFGVALDLWSKEELESTLEDPSKKNQRATKQPAKPAPITSDLPLLKYKIAERLKKRGVTTRDMNTVLQNEFGVSDPHNMTYNQAQDVLKKLEEEQV